MISLHAQKVRQMLFKSAFIEKIIFDYIVIYSFIICADWEKRWRERDRKTHFQMNSTIEL